MKDEQEDVQEKAHAHIKGVRESSKDDESEELRSIREAKIKEAQDGNPYPNKLRD